VSANTGFQDRQLTCVECGQQFVFTAGEQEFFRDQGLTDDPQRCPPCRRARKEIRADAQTQRDTEQESDEQAKRTPSQKLRDAPQHDSQTRGTQKQGSEVQHERGWNTE